MSQSEYSRSPQHHNQRRPIVALVVVVVLCLAAFSLGIFVGKKRQKIAGVVESGSPVTHPAASKPDVVGGENVYASARDGIMASVEKTSPVLVTEGRGARTAAQSAVDSVQAPVSQKNSDPVTQPVSIAKSPLGSGINSVPVMAKVAIEVDSVVAPVAPEPATAVVAPVTQSPSVAGDSAVPGSVVYVVQVGSFKKRSDAEKVQLKLQKDYTVLVRNVDLGAKGVWFRVLVGPTPTEKVAVQLKAQLESRYKISGFVKKTTL